VGVGPILGEPLVDIRRFANFARHKRTMERPKRVHFFLPDTATMVTPVPDR